MNPIVPTLALAALVAPTLLTSAQPPPAPALPEPLTQPTAPPSLQAPAAPPSLTGLNLQTEHTQKQIAQAERVQDQAQKTIEQVTLALDEAQTEPRLPEIPEELTFEPDPYPMLRFGSSANPLLTSPPLLVLSSDSTDPKRTANLNEDLTVMTRLLSKAVNRISGPERKDAMGIFLSQTHSDRRSQSFFLEGYGLLFWLEVPFPLLPPPAAAKEKDDSADDNAWEETRRELQLGSTEKRVSSLVQFHANTAPYNPKRVDQLKDALLEAIPNARHIRALPESSSIAVLVTGPEPTAEGAYQTRLGAVIRKERRQSGLQARPDPPSRNESSSQTQTVVVEKKSGLSQRRTTLVLVAKKTDIDRLAQNKITPDEFKKNVSVQTY